MAYILSLDINRLISGIRKQNGMEPGAESYGGWEKGGGGCTYGHYLSACALMYASTNDERFLERVNSIVSELKKIQANTDDGWFFGGRDGFAKVQNGDLYLTKPDDAAQPWNFNENGNFWYSAHKVLAGLRDAYWYVVNNEAKDILLNLGEWILNWSQKTNSDLFQAMLSVEQGGMNEVIADLFSISNDQRYLELAHKFTHTNVIYPVAVGEDVLFARHANDQIPKFIGASRIYELSGVKTMQAAAFNFWDMVINNHTSVIGGNGLYERFGMPDEHTNRLGYSSSETCNTYNMLKLSRRLFTLTGDSKYMDYFERGLYNQILGSQEPETGCVTYFTSLMPGMFKFYSTPENSFWCCVGTGMENHAKYNESIFFHDNTNLLINLFIPATLNWDEKGLKLNMSTSFPESDTIQVKFENNKAFSGSIYIRRPNWLKTSPTITCNNLPSKFKLENGFIHLKGSFKAGDVISLVLPQKLYLETMKDDKFVSSILYGPLVLAAELGNRDLPELHIESPHNMEHFPRPIKNIPFFVGSKTDLDSWIKKDESNTTRFVAKSAIEQ